MLGVLAIQNRLQLLGERKDAAITILRRPAVKPDGPCDALAWHQLFAKIDLPPFERQNLAVDPPSGNGGEPNYRSQGRRQSIADRIKLVTFEEPGTNVSLDQHRDVRPIEQFSGLHGERERALQRR